MRPMIQGVTYRRVGALIRFAAEGAESLLTAQQLGELLGVTRRTVYRWVREGRIEEDQRLFLPKEG